MPSVGEASCTTDTARIINNMPNEGGKISRVSKLRDMFQNGVVRPIEEIDNVVPFEESLPECGSVQQPFPNFHRSFPGSPPLSALRAHRMSLNANPPVTTTISSPLTVPPACPPKPRHLVIDKLSPTSAVKHSHRTVSPSSFAVNPTEKDYHLKTCIQMFENGPSTANPALQNGKISTSVFSSTPPIVTAPNKTTSDDLVNGPAPIEVTVSVSITPNTSATSPASSSTAVAGSFAAVVQATHTQDGEAENPDASMFHTPVGRLSSWQGSAALNRLSSPADQHQPPEDCRQFVVQPDAFQSQEDSSPGTGPLHAEPIALGNAEEDEEVEGVEEEHQQQEDEGEVVAFGEDVQPTLPVPKGLRVVVVNPNGVHILDDGNFFYAAPWLLDEGDAVEDDDASRTSQDSRHADVALSLRLYQDDGAVSRGAEQRKPHVRFSSDPVLVYSTYSVLEYNRRNEEIDPLGASAEYELEKHLESMDLVSVDLRKTAQGLGFSILGLGVDQFGGSQKLGIFIKALTPGGAAELDGRIKVYDQIVEVDGISLVGVASEFAATTLRSTQEVVHFVLAREKDPENSRVAKLLRQQEREQNLADNDDEDGDYGNNDDAFDDESPNAAGNQLSDTSFTPETRDRHIPHDDSLEALKRHLSTLSSDCHSLEEDDYESGKPLEFTANPLFERFIADSGQSSPPFCSAAQQLASPNVVTQTSPADAASPRSALKGTATAASTQRREEAVSLLIQLATNEVRSSSSPGRPEEEVSGDLSDRIAWCLASNLHDCHGILIRQRSRLRSMEQRLTAQEAAADEAIERLCLQCRHLEAELVRTSEQLRQHHSPAGRRASQSPVRSSAPTVESAHTNGGFKRLTIPQQPTPVNGNHVTSTASPQVTEVSSNPDQHSPGQPLSLVQQVKQSLGSLALASLSPPGPPLQAASSDKCPSPRPGDGDSRGHVTSASAGAHVQPLPTHLQQVQARLHVSGGLASRRPPTRVVVGPPFAQQQDRDLFPRSPQNPPLVETNSHGSSYVPVGDDRPTGSPVKNRPLDPRPLPVNFQHRSRQQLSPIQRSAPVSKLAATGDRPPELWTSLTPSSSLPESLSRSPTHLLPPIGSSSTSTLHSSTPVSACHRATSEQVPALNQVIVCHTPPKSVPNRPQPIRTPGHPTPLQLQQQNWQRQRARTASASPSPSAS